MIPGFRLPFGTLVRLGPLGALPRIIRLWSLYSRFMALRSCFPARRSWRLAAGLTAPPVTKEINEPLLAG